MSPKSSDAINNFSADEYNEGGKKSNSSFSGK